MVGFSTNNWEFAFTNHSGLHLHQPNPQIVYPTFYLFIGMFHKKIGLFGAANYPFLPQSYETRYR
jgi:hypothetical protein